jgi:hypothetical protein
MSASVDELDKPVQSSISLKPDVSDSTFRVKPTPTTDNNTRKMKFRFRLYKGNRSRRVIPTESARRPNPASVPVTETTEKIDLTKIPVTPNPLLGIERGGRFRKNSHKRMGTRRHKKLRTRRHKKRSNKRKY